MPGFLILAFLFLIGSAVGWGIEVVFRRFFSANNPQHRWINPGFLVGPYLPLYGFSLCILFLLAGLESKIPIQSLVGQKLVLFAVMAACVTVLEYFTGLVCIKVLKVRLWDYSMLWGNLQGIICPLFSFFWAILSAAYYFLVHPHIIDALTWLANNLAFSFFVGLFFGVFALDVYYSVRILPAIKRFAKEEGLTVVLDEFKESIRQSREEEAQKVKFFFTMRANNGLADQLRQYSDKLKAKLEEEYKRLEK